MCVRARVYACGVCVCAQSFSHAAKFSSISFFVEKYIPWHLAFTHRHGRSGSCGLIACKNSQNWSDSKLSFRKPTFNSWTVKRDQILAGKRLLNDACWLDDALQFWNFYEFDGKARACFFSGITHALACSAAFHPRKHGIRYKSLIHVCSLACCVVICGAEPQWHAVLEIFLWTCPRFVVAALNCDMIGQHEPKCRLRNSSAACLTDLEAASIFNLLCLMKSGRAVNQKKD